MGISRILCANSTDLERFVATTGSNPQETDNYRGLPLYAHFGTWKNRVT